MFQLTSREANLVVVVFEVGTVTHSFLSLMNFDYRDLERLEQENIVKVSWRGVEITAVGEDMLDAANAIYLTAEEAEEAADAE